MVTDSTTEEPALAYTHPLYLGPSDTLSGVLILIKLTGSENYGLWSRPMKIALLGKRKLGFVMVLAQRSRAKQNCMSNGKLVMLLYFHG